MLTLRGTTSQPQWALRLGPRPPDDFDILPRQRFDPGEVAGRHGLRFDQRSADAQRAGAGPQEFGRRVAAPLLLAVLGSMAIVSLWTPLSIDRIAERWFSLPNLFYLWPIPLVTALVGYLVFVWLNRGDEVKPFLGSVVLFLLGYLGLVISTYPYLVPPHLTFWDTAAAGVLSDPSVAKTSTGDWTVELTGDSGRLHRAGDDGSVAVVTDLDTDALDDLYREAFQAG